MRELDQHAERAAPGLPDVLPQPVHLAAAALARQFAGSRSVHVISPRSNSIVDALELAGVRRRDLVLQELDPALASLLSTRYPAARLIRAAPEAAPVLIHSATKAGRTPGAVLCSLPLMLMTRGQRVRFVQGCLDAAPSSVFIAWAAWPPLPPVVPGLTLLAVSGWSLLAAFPCRAWAFGRAAAEHAHAH